MSTFEWAALAIMAAGFAAVVYVLNGMMDQLAKGRNTLKSIAYALVKPDAMEFAIRRSSARSTAEIRKKPCDDAYEGLTREDWRIQIEDLAGLLKLSEQNNADLIVRPGHIVICDDARAATLLQESRG